MSTQNQSQLLKPTWGEVKAHLYKTKKTLIADCCKVTGTNVNAWLNELIDQNLPDLCRKADARRAKIKAFVNRARRGLKTIKRK